MAGLDQRRERLRGYVLNVGDSGVDLIHFALDEIDSSDMESHLCELDGEGESHIAKADDSYASGPVFYLPG